MPTKEQNLEACSLVHKALWMGISPKNEDGIRTFFSRLAKVTAAELTSLANGDGKKAERLLHEVVVEATEESIAFLINDPSVRASVELLNLLNALRPKS